MQNSTPVEEVGRKLASLTHTNQLVVEYFAQLVFTVIRSSNIHMYYMELEMLDSGN